MSADRNRLSKIKSGVFSRGLALAKVSVSAGARAAGHAVGNLFSADEDREDRVKALLMSQIGLLTRELGQLKGSLMKVGQLLSMYGEHFLPPEANALLKSLQSESPPLEWQAIEKVLRRQLPPEKLAELEIDPEPHASASLGQVHRARRKSDGAELAMKIQYPGVDAAIEGDLKALRSLLSVSKLIPRGPKYDELFGEVRMMLHHEVDYERELRLTDEFREALADDPRFVVPRTFPEYSSKRVLTTSFEPGVPVDSPEVRALPRERRDRIAEAALEVYFRELFRMGKVQTDPHFGNYRVRLSDAGDRLVLFDFGAVRQFPKDFLEPYYRMVRAAIDLDAEGVARAAEGFGFLKPDDSPEARQLFGELCILICEPFMDRDTPGVAREFFDAEGRYDWGASDLPKRVARMGADFAFAFKLRPPPREVVFLDRKMGGVFIFLSVLQARIRARPLLERYLTR